MKRMNLEIRITQSSIFHFTSAVECKLVCDTKEKYYSSSWYYTPFQFSYSSVSRITLLQYWCNWFLRPEQTLVTINHCNALLVVFCCCRTTLYLTSGVLKYRQEKERSRGLIFQFLMMGFPSVSILAMMSWQLSQRSQYIQSRGYAAVTQPLCDDAIRQILFFQTDCLQLFKEARFSFFAQPVYFFKLFRFDTKSLLMYLENYF